MMNSSFLIRKVSRLLQSNKTSRVSGNLIGYENIELITEIVTKTIKRRNELKSGAPLSLAEMRSLIGLLELKSSNLKVLDFGGGAGTHFDTFSSVFPNLNFEYFVVETPEMVKMSKKLRTPEENLTFLTMEELKNVSKQFDLLLLNSSLQYTLDPVSTFQGLIELMPSSIWITRFPLNEELGTLTIRQVSNLSDNGPGSSTNISDLKVEYQATILSRASFEVELLKKYKIVAKFEEEQSPFGHSFPSVHAWGYLVSLSDKG
jgi:putative methyltransferase (TIGR04325 family)